MRAYYAGPVQRAFSTFPFGLTGFALAAFRICVASQSLVRFWPAASHHGSWVLIAAIALAFGLLLGIATPFLAALIASARLLQVITLEQNWNVDPAFDIAFALVLAALGPGAYSLDAKLYGRRRIEVSYRASGGDDPQGDEATPSL